MKLIPKKWYSYNYIIRDGYHHITDLNISCWREKGHFHLYGQPFYLYKDSMLRGDYVLESDRQVQAFARKPSLFSSRLEVICGEEHFTLKRKSILGRTMTLWHANQQIGRISPEGSLSRKANIDLPDHLPMPIRVFLVWLVVSIWKNEQMQ